MANKSPLKAYNLTSPPFELGRLDGDRVGRVAEWDRLQDLIARARASVAPIMGVILGTYGSGKTFLLWQLRNSMRPATKTRVLASGPIRMVDPEQRKDFVKGVVFRYFSRGIDIEVDLLPLLKNGSAARLPEGMRPYGEILMALARQEAAPIARRLLTGGRVTRKEAEIIGPGSVTQVKTNEEAMWLLQALQVLVKSAGIETVVFLLDEVEFIEGLPKGQQTAAIDSIKHIWDQAAALSSSPVKAAQLLFVLAATPAFWSNLNAKIREEAARGQSGVGLTPFLARISQSVVVEIAELGPDEAKDLIVTRMNKVRIGQPKDKIIPFTPDYVNYVYEMSQGLPRQIMEICSVVIEEAARQDLERIDKKAAVTILRDLLISYEPVGKRQ